MQERSNKICVKSEDPAVDAPASSLAFQPFDRVSLLGVVMDRMELGDLRGWLDAALASGRPHQVVTANLDFLAIARKNPDFARIVAGADLVVCDGKPLQWAAGMKSRVTGNDIVLQTARLSAERGYRLFLLGAYPGVADRAADRLRELAPASSSPGHTRRHAGPSPPEQDAEIVAAIQAARPHALFVALGAPRQDEWIARHPELGVPLSVGVGGAFNFLAGETRRAPLWMQRLGLEWAHRLISEPARLWRRYLIDDLPLAALLAPATPTAVCHHARRRSRSRARRGAMPFDLAGVDLSWRAGRRRVDRAHPGRRGRGAADRPARLRGDPEPRGDCGGAATGAAYHRAAHDALCDPRFRRTTRPPSSPSCWRACASSIIPPPLHAARHRG